VPVSEENSGESISIRSANESFVEEKISISKGEISESFVVENISNISKDKICDEENKENVN